MFDYIRGKVETKRVDYVTIDVGGAGYKIFISLNTYSKIGEGIEKLYIYNYIREDTFTLYGFYTEEEREFFQILINASGIGPKIAMAILSTYSVEELKGHIEREELKMLTKIPGLGIKKAQKLVVDVKDKVISKLKLVTAGETVQLSGYREDVYMALESLGYNEKDITGMLDKEDFSKYTKLEDAIKGVLKKIKI